MSADQFAIPARQPHPIAPAAPGCSPGTPGRTSGAFDPLVEEGISMILEYLGSL
jgi:hypothetical protein